MKNNVLAALLALTLWALPAHAADQDIGIFETIFKSSVSFSATNETLHAAIEASDFQLQAVHDVRVPGDKHQAKLYVLTSPAFIEVAAAESPRTVSAQLLRVAVFTTGDQQATVVNMANPVAHAMLYYSESSRYDELVNAATSVAEAMRQLTSSLDGSAVSLQMEPRRTEKKYRKFNGDGPAKMMAKFRDWNESQLTLLESSASDFEKTVDDVVARLQSAPVSDADKTTGWEIVSRVDFGDDAVHLGLTNPFLEDRMIRINSRFRSEGKSDASPYPGVDHVAALPTDLLIVKEGNKTHVLHYGQMWRMQLYFWDSGYRAFTANVGVPGDIVNSIEEVVQADE